MDVKIRICGIAKLFDDEPVRLRGKTTFIYVLLLAINASAWIWAFFAFRYHPVVVGTALTFGAGGSGSFDGASSDGEFKLTVRKLEMPVRPRGVLADFGVRLPDDTEIRIWDSTAEIRYLVLPMRPAGTDGWSEDKLADLVTRDSMIGTGLPKTPEGLK